MAFAQMSMDELDSIYGGLWTDIVKGINLFIAIGGDSHGKRIFLECKPLFCLCFLVLAFLLSVLLSRVVGLLNILASRNLVI